MTQEERLQEKERQLEELKERNRKAEEALRIRNMRLRNAVDKKKKKIDTRSKILTGAAVMEAAKTSPEYSRMIRHARQRHLTRKSDRAVFGLPPLDNPGRTRHASRRAQRSERLAGRSDPWLESEAPRRRLGRDLRGRHLQAARRGRARRLPHRREASQQRSLDCYRYESPRI